MSSNVNRVERDLVTSRARASHHRIVDNKRTRIGTWMMCLAFAATVGLMVLAQPVGAIPHEYGYKSCGTATVWTESYGSGGVYHKHGGSIGTQYLDAYWWNNANYLRNSTTTENATTLRAEATGKLFSYPDWTFGYCVGGGPS